MVPVDTSANAAVSFTATSCVACINQIYNLRLPSNGKYMCIPTTGSNFRCLYAQSADGLFDETITVDLFVGNA